MAPKTKTPTPKGAILSRLSRKAEERKVLTVEVQESDQRAHAGRLGVPIVAAFAEDGVSGYKRIKRPSFDALCETIATDGITHLFVRALDRASRRGSEIMRLIELCQDAGTLVVIDGAAHDPRDPAVALLLGIQGLFGNYESAMISKRTGASKAKMLDHYSGRLPFGYVKPANTAPGYFAQHPEQAQAIRDGFRMIVHEHRSSAAVAREWNGRGLRTSEGRMFTASKAQRTLEAGVMAGLRVRDGEVVAELKLPDGSPFPAILTRPERDELRAVLGARARRTATGSGATPRAGLLSGVACCGKCGAPLSIHRHRDAPEKSFYACRADGQRCNGCSIKVALVEPHIERAVLDVLQSAKFRRALARKRKIETRGEDPAVLEAELDAIAEQRGSGELSEREYRAMREPLRARYERALALIDDGSEHAVLFPFTSGDVTATWKGTSDEHRQAVVAALVERIDVQPVKRQGQRPAVEARVRPEDIRWRI